MAYKRFAHLDNNNVVVNIILGSDEGISTEQKMADHLNINVSLVKEYSLDGSHLSRTTPAKGGTFESSSGSNGKFKDPQPNPSWTFNNTSWEWEAPVTKPTDFDETYNYWWNESELRWEGLKVDGAPNYNPTEDPIVHYRYLPDTNSWEAL